MHLRWGDRGNGSGLHSSIHPRTDSLPSESPLARHRDGTDLFDGNFGVITQVVGRDSLDIFSLGTGVAANINALNFARGLYAQLDPNEVGRPIVGIVPHQLLPGVQDGQVARWDSSTGYWEASEAPEGTDSENETLAEGVAFTFTVKTWRPTPGSLCRADSGIPIGAGCC